MIGSDHLFAFCDESGFPIPSDPSPFSVVVAVCIPVKNIRTLTKMVHQLKERIYEKSDIEIKATKFINPAILKPTRTRNLLFIDQLFSIMSRIDMGLYSIILKRPDFVPIQDNNFLPPNYTFLLQRVNSYGKLRKTSASVIFDGQDHSKDEQLASSFNNLVFKAVGYENIVEMPLFVSSKLVPGIQIADICAGVIRHHYCCSDATYVGRNEFKHWIDTKYKYIRQFSKNHTIRGQSHPGIYLMPSENFARYTSTNS